MPPEKAFVVQFREPSGSEIGQFSGRVEHMMSGQNSQFAKPGDLLEFFAQVMNRKVLSTRDDDAGEKDLTK